MVGRFSGDAVASVQDSVGVEVLQSFVYLFDFLVGREEGLCV